MEATQPTDYKEYAKLMDLKTRQNPLEITLSQDQINNMRSLDSKVQCDYHGNNSDYLSKIFFDIMNEVVENPTHLSTSNTGQRTYLISSKVIQKDGFEYTASVFQGIEKDSSGEKYFTLIPQFHLSKEVIPGTPMPENPGYSKILFIDVNANGELGHNEAVQFKTPSGEESFLIFSKNIDAVLYTRCYLDGTPIVHTTFKEDKAIEKQKELQNQYSELIKETYNLLF